MSDAEFDRHMAGLAERRRARSGTRPVEQEVVRPEATPPRPLPPVRAPLPFGQRIRDLRCALGWTQREVAVRLGVSARSIIRYEQGRSAPLHSAPLRALRRLESANVRELDIADARP
jgi:ribosome-binding protein aMBF1 (putative translation factor)